jgi:hypothetical protein
VIGAHGDGHRGGIDPRTAGEILGGCGMETELGDLGDLPDELGLGSR